MGRNRTKALGKLYKKITNTELPTDANTTTEALQKVYEALTQDNKHHINVTDIIEDLAANWSGGGGGGSSDFSTANVTIVNNTEDTLNLPIPQCVEENALAPGSPAMIYSYTDEITSVTQKTIKAPLYKGSLYIANITVTDVSGDATITDGDVLVTGDCTITISGGVL